MGYWEDFADYARIGLKLNIFSDYMDDAGWSKKVIFLFDFFVARYYIINMGEVVDGMTNGLLKSFDRTNNKDVKKMIEDDPRIITVKELLKNKDLQIPDYQRPYKWTEKNVNQLIDDILEHNRKKKSAYRLGTLVIHKDKHGKLNIVDGQQRTITLVLIICALKNNKMFADTTVLSDFTTNLADELRFSINISRANIQNNYKIIERRALEFEKDSAVLFFLNKCEFVEIILTDVSEAFQFFDSQNARGKDLEPHDLLKAFHLREMNESSTEEEKLIAVKHWENMDEKELSKLFADYLYRIRNWSKGRSAMHFTKKEVDIFKGVSPKMEKDYPFVRQVRMAHYYIENYNRFFSAINNNFLDYPFQIDQTIINGKRFFEMITHYDNLINNKLIDEIKKYTDSSIISTIESYPGNYRIGDKYVRKLFLCGLIYYVDKFGVEYLSEVVYMLFIWAYSLRLRSYRVGLNAVDNYALLGNEEYAPIKLFTTIREASYPDEILNILKTEVKVLQDNKIKQRIGEVVELFKGKKYYV